MNKLNVNVSFCLLLILFMAGCAAKPETMEAFFYPPAPDEARLQWLGTIGNPSDLTFSKTKTFTEFLVGENTTPAFSGPMGVAATSNGQILVSNLYTRNIGKFGLEGETINSFTPTVFQNNIGIAVDAQDRVFVADGKVNKVLVFSGSGEPLYAIGDAETFGKPVMLAVNNRLDRLYVSDALDHSIKVFSLDGEFLFSFGQRGQADGEFYAPQGLAINGEDRVYVADMLNARIQVFSSEGEFVDKFGERGQFPQQFENPKGLAFDSDGNLYVVDARRPNFRMFTPEGELLLQLGSNQRSAHIHGFVMPVTISVDGDDRVLIGDFLTNRVTVWQYLSKKYKARQKAQGS